MNTVRGQNSFNSVRANYDLTVLQDGAERVIESLSLIDAVMPDVVESRKQAAAKNQQIKQEAQSSNTNGDDAPPPSIGQTTTSMNSKYDNNE